jgi:putative membrane protein
VLRSPEWASLSANADALDAWTLRLWARRRDVGVSAVWHVLSWLLGAAEIWLALRLLGHPVSIATAVAIESLAEAIRTAAFAVPAALGVQEGGFVLLGSVFGFGPELAIALSLTKRFRELCLGIPGLVAWQLETASHAVAARMSTER